VIVVSNFVNDAVIGKAVLKEGFFEELTENPFIRLVIFIGSVAISGYFIIMFSKELWAVLFPAVKVT